MIKLYTDAATKGNPGPSAAGALVVGEHIHLQKKQFLAKSLSNHEAEFLACIFGLEILIAENLTTQNICLFTDSQIVAQTIDQGKTKNEQYQLYLTKINNLMALFPLSFVKWIPDSQNKGAHHLAQQALKQYYLTLPS